MRNYQLQRSSRKTVSISIDDHLQVIVKAPKSMPRQLIDQTVASHEKWIQIHLRRKAAYLKTHPPLTKQQEEALKEKAKKLILPRVAYYSALMGLTPSGVKITAAKKRFGSCSGQNGLCFSCYLANYPPEAIDYVTVHELAHIRYHNHSRDFYQLISQYMPDYKEREQLLKE